jgi:hypothetical protein
MSRDLRAIQARNDAEEVLEMKRQSLIDDQNRKDRKRRRSCETKR